MSVQNHYIDSDPMPTNLSDPVFAPPSLTISNRDDGSRILGCGYPLTNYPVSLGSYLLKWAHLQPDQPFLAERKADGHWTALTYKEVLDKTYCIATWLLGLKIEKDSTIGIISGNNCQHALMVLAANHVGIPVCSLSTATALGSGEYSRLKASISLISPCVILVDEYKTYERALNSIADLHHATIVYCSGDTTTDKGLKFDEILSRQDAGAVSRAFTKVNGDTVAKLQFTSGSTGVPKAVISTHRMMVSNQESKALVWPFLNHCRPVLVDWLPWSHTFGGNHNFNMALRNGGTLYIDQGKPVPGQFATTIKNLTDVSPTVYFNVPRGFDMLVQTLKVNAELRTSFFKDLRVICYAAAALPKNIWDDLARLSIDTIGRELPMVSSWGTTETAPLATDCFEPSSAPGIIGLPIPGCELKLIPVDGKYEVRVRGANITPGYWKQPEATAKAFDGEGFYITGDAMKFESEHEPEKGLVFSGRLAEDFKLSSGTWVHVGAFRISAIESLGGLAQDVVIAGHDRDYVSILIFPNIRFCETLCALREPEKHPAHLLARPEIRLHVEKALRKLANIGGGSSMYAARALILSEPPSVEDGEITEKGYINQRAVLTRRSTQVDLLYGASQANEIIRLPSQ